MYITNKCYSTFPVLLALTGEINSQCESGGCSDVYAPVCGKDAENNTFTFGNSCELGRYNCANEDDRKFNVLLQSIILIKYVQL
jgi:Kazal-type serine protease inhibitor domain.